MPIHVERVGGGHEGAVSTAICWAKFMSLEAPCLVLRHHRSVFVHGVGGDVGCISGGARKALTQKFLYTIRSWESPHLKDVGAKCAQQHKSIRGFDAIKNDVGGHELQESSGIGDITAIGNRSLQSSALDHECGARILREQCEAVALDLGTLRCVELHGAVDG